MNQPTSAATDPRRLIVTPVVTAPEAQRVIRGCAAVLPAGRPHGFVVTSESARYLTVHHGPAFEQFITAAADAGVGAPDQLTAIAAAHGIHILGPPPAL